MSKTTTHEKAEWYDALCELLDMGLDLDRNSSRALIGATNELLRIKAEKEEWKS